jgi:cardiolipin synthase (CMP-forming)
VGSVESPIVSEIEAPAVSSRVLTVPNLLSFFRLLMVPVFLVLIVTGNDLIALVVLVVSTATDYLDGVIARRFGQITRLGQLLDPAADRLFIFATLIGLAIRDILPWWLVAVIVGRDVLLAVLGIVMANIGYGPLPVHHLGKFATFLLFYALPIIVLGHAVPVLQFVTDPLGWATALWGAFLYWWAGVIYLRQARTLFRESRQTSEAASVTLDRQGGQA